MRFTYAPYMKYPPIRSNNARVKVIMLYYLFSYENGCNLTKVLDFSLY